MNRLFLNNKEVDIEQVVISVTKQVNDIAELRDSQNHHSNKFELPFTANNKIVLDYLGIDGNQSRKPYERISVNYIEDGHSVITDGYAVISSFKNRNGRYTVTIYDGNIFLFEAMGTKKLNELDLSSLDHQLTEANYIASYPNTTGYIYAVSDTGRFNPIPKIEVNYQMPSIFVSTIFDKIMSEAGFAYSGDVFTNHKFEKLVITPKRGYNSETDAISNPINITISGNTQTNTVYPCEFCDQVNSGIIRYPMVFTPNISIMNYGIITITETGQYSLNITTTLSSTFVSANSMGVKVVRNGVVIATGAGVFNGATLKYDVSYSATFSFQAGEQIQVYYYFDGFASTLLNGTFTHESTNFTFSSTSSAVVDLNIADFIGDMTQTAFVKDIMQRFGLVIQKVKNVDEYEFKKFQDIILDTANAIDWSDKFNEITNTNYNTKNFGQNNRFAYHYRNQEDYKYADGFLKVDNKNLKEERTHLIAPYYACEQSETLLNNKRVTSTPFWEIIRNEDGTLKSYKPLKSKNYIAEIKYIDEDINYGLSNGTPIPFSGNVPRLDFDFINYQRIIDENYEKLKLLLDWNKIITATFLLNKRDVSHVDFFKLIYIRQLNSYYYLNKIKSYKQGRLTSCELVKVQPTIFECDLVANAGSYLDSSKSELSMIINGQASFGNITTWAWTLISKPAGAVTSFDDVTASITNFHTDLAGNYIIRLTISNADCEDFNETQITKLP